MLHHYDYTYIRICQHFLVPIHQGRHTVAKIERVERQSARFIMADYSHHSSVTNMLTNLKLPSLDHRRTTSNVLQDHSQPYQYPLISYDRRLLECL